MFLLGEIKSLNIFGCTVNETTRHKNISQYFILLDCTALVLCGVVRCGAVRCDAVPHCAVLYYSCAVLCCSAQYSTVLSVHLTKMVDNIM